VAYGAVSYEPFTSLQAHLKIIDVEEVDGAFEDTPRQLRIEFKVLDYEESEDDGDTWINWTFRDWFGFSRDKKTGEIGISKSTKAKLPNLIKATLGKEVIERGEFDPPMLMDHEIRARVARSGKHEDGDHSRVKSDSIMPKPKRPKQDRDLEDVDVENLDTDASEAPDFSDLEEEAS
jgi:hypothetical protein